MDKKGLRKGFLRAGLAGALAALLLVIGFSAVSAAPAIGQPAPDFAATDSNGKTVKLSDYRGKVVVLEWTNHQCPYVGKHYGSGNMQAVQKDATAQGVVWLTIISSAKGEQGYVEPAAANQLTSNRAASPSAVLIDPTGKIGQAYGAKTTPHMYIIDKSGNLVYMGGIDDKPTSNPADIPSSKNYVKAALGEMAAGKPVSEPVTRAYGCTIKYSS